ncbi:MAG TPA: UDP-N-acetylmuramate dehydrogenase [Kofleriaceae bacterium]|jgi:UDP-N-acetylmuramate dehydrogenase
MDRDVPLAPLTTLGLGGPAKQFVRATSEAQLIDALHAAGTTPVLFLGGGSNLVVRDGGFGGLVIQIAIPGIDIESAPDHAMVTANAGVVWDDFVAQMINARLSGVECLSGIPGLVGATPMQNVGAYGQEVSQTIDSVRVLDRAVNRISEMLPRDCTFGYRSSVFRGSDRWVILSVRFRLPRSTQSAPIKYAELSKALGVSEGATAPLQLVRDTVIALRRGKGMVVDAADPDSRSAGSFFTNPLVDARQLGAVQAAVAKHSPGVTMPMFPAENGKTKLAAGWLIERAGFAKGTTRGNVAISSKHALALVNRGGTTTELLALANEIIVGVRDAFGVTLEPEPIIVGA